MELKEGDIIQVHGFIMLEKIEGTLKVKYIFNRFGYKDAYAFIRPKGKNIIVSHYCDNIDCYLNKKISPINYIEKIN